MSNEIVAEDSAAQRKIDISYLGQSRIFLGVKRTWLFALHVSAFDPKDARQL